MRHTIYTFVVIKNSSQETYMENNMNIRMSTKCRQECNSPCLPFQISKRCIAKVSKFFPIDLEQRTHQIPNMDETQAFDEEFHCC